MAKATFILYVDEDGDMRGKTLAGNKLGNKTADEVLWDALVYFFGSNSLAGAFTITIEPADTGDLND